MSWLCAPMVDMYECVSCENENVAGKTRMTNVCVRWRRALLCFSTSSWVVRALAQEVAGPGFRPHFTQSGFKPVPVTSQYSPIMAITQVRHNTGPSPAFFFDAGP